MNRYELEGEIFLAKGCCEGILIEPELPAGFFCTPNQDRPAEQRKWWGRAFVMTHENMGHEVLVLDGGCHDRPTYKTRGYLTLDQAVVTAQGLQGGTWDSWPGRHFPAPPTDGGDEKGGFSGVRLLAEIKKSSKYFRQTPEGERFRVCIQGCNPQDYVVLGGPGGQYRLADVKLFAESVDGGLIQLTK